MLKPTINDKTWYLKHMGIDEGTRVIDVNTYMRELNP